MCVCCFFLFLIILSWLLFYFLTIIYLNQEWPTYGQPWIILRPSRFIVILLNNALGGGCSLEKVFERVTIFRRIVYTIANQMKKHVAAGGAFVLNFFGEHRGFDVWWARYGLSVTLYYFVSSHCVLGWGWLYGVVFYNAENSKTLRSLYRSVCILRVMKEVSWIGESIIIY